MRSNSGKDPAHELIIDFSRAPLLRVIATLISTFIDRHPTFLLPASVTYVKKVARLAGSSW